MAVIVFTKPACVQCNATYKALDKKGVSYKSVDITQDPETLEKLKALGHMSAPVVAAYDESGNVIVDWAGFRPDKIEENADLLKAASV